MNQHHKSKAENIVNALSGAANSSRLVDTKAIWDEVAILHRTEKQNLGSLIFAIVAEFSRDYEKKNYDARNEATCKRAHKMLKGLPENERDQFYVPYI
tara:strand:+ start:248 stop:541 length:294 start_codon:yes stop_codon:yes gene_type:complete